MRGYCFSKLIQKLVSEEIDLLSGESEEEREKEIFKLDINLGLF